MPQKSLARETGGTRRRDAKSTNGGSKKKPEFTIRQRRMANQMKLDHEGVAKDLILIGVLAGGAHGCRIPSHVATPDQRNDYMAAGRLHLEQRYSLNGDLASVLSTYRKVNGPGEVKSILEEKKNGQKGSH
jgi:hypothetical protein